MNDTLVSVIVTYYNKENVLRRCLDSIIKQTYSNIEIIIVDDGSKKEAAKLCDTIKKEDSRIKVIHKENGGEVSARKAGLKKAHGEYVLYVDADDWIDEGMVQLVLCEAKKVNADVVTSGWIIHKGDIIEDECDIFPSGLYSSADDKKTIAEQVFFRSSQEKTMNDSLNTKLFRKDLIEKCLIPFPESVIYAEDTFVAFVCLALANRIYVSKECHYHYMTQDSTINNEHNDFLLRDLNESYVYSKRMLQEGKCYEVFKNQLERVLLSFLFLGINKFMDLEENHLLIRYYFPCDNIPKGARIALYGAGAVGQSYYSQLERDYEIVFWFDKKKKKAIYGQTISQPRKQDIDEVDCVIVAVNDLMIANEIKSELCERLSWDMSKLIWEKPIPIVETVMRRF